MPARTVWESPRFANIDQYVCASYRLWQLNTQAPGGAYWTHVNSAYSCAWIGAAQSSVQLLPAVFDVVPFYGHSVDVTYTWQQANGAVLGTRYVDSAHQSDYACWTSRCTTGTSAVGGFFHLTY